MGSKSKTVSAGALKQQDYQQGPASQMYSIELAHVGPALINGTGDSVDDSVGSINEGCSFKQVQVTLPFR